MTLGFDVISPHKDWITRHQVEVLKSMDVQTIPWTANTPEDWERLIDLGVAGIITDDPKGLIDYLKEKGLRP